MKAIIKLVPAIGFTMMIFSAWSQEIISEIDNWRYWKELAELGIIPFNSNNPVPAPIYKGTQIATPMNTINSPDVLLISGEGVSQSENSVFVNPTNNQLALVSNNSRLSGLDFGANALFSFDGGLNWTGGIGGAGTTNGGDPAVVIDLNGNSYVGYMKNGASPVIKGQGISKTANNGASWATNTIVNPTIGRHDKNHLWVDNSNSIHSGNLYSAWTPINTGSANDLEIEISRSTDHGTTWSTPTNISSAVAAGSHNQGVNVQTGPNGEVYAVWVIYDNWPGPENALGFARSTDGGVTFNNAVRIHNDINGVRWQPNTIVFPGTNPIGKNMRTNSFPSMAVDISGGPNNGNIYVVWSNMGVPGINTGTDVSIYIMKSSDNGTTWSTPLRVNQDAMGNIQYFPWITCDPVTGDLSVIFYDDRNVADTDAEAWVATSTDGGATWTDFRVSDVSFTPAPIVGLGGDYMGDYLGISARGGMVYPVWTDNRTGTALAYTSPFSLGCQDNLTITADVPNGNTNHMEALNTITVSNTVFSNAEAVYHAGDEVLMTDDFTAINGCEYRAYIEPCSGNFVKSAAYDPDIPHINTKKPKRAIYYQPDKTKIDLKISPNPTQGLFRIELDGEYRLDNFDVKIYSMSSGLVYANTFSGDNLKQFQVDISEFRNGIYIIELTNKTTNEVFSGKISKN